jgi:hypothetical protein
VTIKTVPLQTLSWADKDPGKGPRDVAGALTDQEAEKYVWTATIEGSYPGKAPDLISSRLDAFGWNGDHVVAIDVDFPVSLVESSPGKHHVVIHKALTWRKYRALLIALEQAGVIEPGYLEASIHRKATYLRVHPTTPLEVHLDDGKKVP